MDPNRRRSIRRKTCIKATIMSRDGVCHQAVISDISVGGCCLVTPYRGLVPGGEITILLRIHDKPIELYAKVVHFYQPTRHSVVGVEFLRTCLDAYRELVRLIYSDEAAQIAVLAKASQANKKYDH